MGLQMGKLALMALAVFSSTAAYPDNYSPDLNFNGVSSARHSNWDVGGSKTHQEGGGVAHLPPASEPSKWQMLAIALVAIGAVVHRRQAKMNK